jgi:SAM-dependent methyltransferase
MNPNDIRSIAASFQESRIILSAFELDIFTSIDKSGSTADQVADKLNLDCHACERLMNALVSLDLLTKRNNLFFNTPASFKFLSKKSPDCMGGLMHTNHLWNTWSNLTKVVITGIAAHPAEINERGDNWLVAFITAMHDRAKKQAPEQLADLDLSGINTILDVGGGAGAFSMEFVRRNPEIEAVVFDLPNVVPITRQFIEKEGFTGKIKTFEGDYTKDELPGGFDLVFLSAIIHSNSLETNADLIRKCYKAANKNGKIVIQDWIMNNDRTQPVSGAIFAINMLVGTPEGDCFTEAEVNGMLTSAGFTNISRKEFDSGLSQVVAHKP